MEGASPHQDTAHTCPGCHRPVEPGSAYCEACGTPLMEQPVCGWCGALLMGPVRSCESCGAPTVLKGNGEGSANGSSQGGDGVVRLAFRRDRPADEPEDEDCPDAADAPMEEDDDELEFVDDGAAEESGDDADPGDEEETRHSRREIVEPDTDEIMEKYWDEEDPDDRPPARSAMTRESKSPAPPQPAEAVSDALFLVSDRKEPVKKKREPVNVRLIAAVVLVIVIAALLWFIGIPLLLSPGDEGPPTRLPDTPGPSATLTMPATIVPTLVPATTGSVLLPQQTQTIPGIGQYAFVVRKDPIDARITVIFAGSSGVDGIDTADITVTREDGAVASAVLMPRKGITEMTLQGSTGTDRVVIIAHMFNGGDYRAYDAMVPFR